MRAKQLFCPPSSSPFHLSFSFLETFFYLLCVFIFVRVMGPVLWLISLCIIKLMGQERKWSLAHTHTEGIAHTHLGFMATLWTYCHISWAPSVRAIKRKLLIEQYFCRPKFDYKCHKENEGERSKERSRQRKRNGERRRAERSERKNLALYTTYSKANNSTVSYRLRSALSNPPPFLPHGQLCAANDVTEHSKRFYIHPPTSKLLVIN